MSKRGNLPGGFAELSHLGGVPAILSVTLCAPASAQLVYSLLYLWQRLPASNEPCNKRSSTQQ